MHETLLFWFNNPGPLMGILLIGVLGTGFLGTLVEEIRSYCRT